MVLILFRSKLTAAADDDYAKHQQAQRLGREKWYEYFIIEVADLVRSEQFERPGTAL